MAGNYPASQEIETAKRDGPFLWKVLGVRGNGPHNKCPLCKNDSLSVFQNKDTGEFAWDCKSGCGGGDVITAMKLLEGKDFKAAKAEIEKAYGSGRAPVYQQQAQSPERQPDFAASKPKSDPVIDMSRAENLVGPSHDFLLQNMHLVSDFKRGLSSEIIKRHRVGFLQNVNVPWKKGNWNIPAAWVLPITDSADVLKGVKLHFEIRPKVRGDREKSEPEFVEFKGKSIWVPLGTRPADEPVHSYYTFWPHPSTLPDPALQEEFSSDMGWWIQRIPEGSVRDKWDDALRWERYQVALSVHKAEDELDPSESYTAVEQAFAGMREEIQSVVSMTGETYQPETTTQASMINWKSFIFLCPGELKALAVLSMGYRAIAVTGGESWMPPLELLAYLRGHNVCLFMDDDGRRIDTRGRVHCPGKEWARKISTALIRLGAQRIICVTGGRYATSIEEDI